MLSWDLNNRLIVCGTPMSHFLLIFDPSVLDAQAGDRGHKMPASDIIKVSGKVKPD